MTNLSLKQPILISALIITLLFAFSISVYLSFSPENTIPKKSPDFFFGVTSGGTVAETKETIDKVKDYTNVIAFTNLGVTKNLSSLEEVAGYAAANQLHFFVQTAFPSPYGGFNFDPFQ